MLDGLRGEDSIAELCRREGIAQGPYYSWSKEFLESGKKRLVDDLVLLVTANPPDLQKPEHIIADVKGITDDD